MAKRATAPIPKSERDGPPLDAAEFF
jgi:CRP/FNR family cyclic AMP-dependent transcriptional regulator